MQISSSTLSTNVTTNSQGIRTNFTEKISKEEAADIKSNINENAKNFALNSVNTQGSLASQGVDQETADFQSFLSDIGYDGKNIGDLSQDEATALVSEDGFFGVDQTAERMADFVISGANGDESMLRAGRDGMIQGYKDAEEMWGGELPEISQKTMDAALELVDKEMNSLGYSILNTEA